MQVLVVQDGVPLAGVRVVARVQETAPEVMARLGRGQLDAPMLTYGVTDAAGMAVMDVGNEPVVGLALDGPGLSPDVLWWASGDRQVALAAKRAQLVRGRVVASGRPVEGALVVWFGYEGGIEARRTNARGEYEAPDPRLWAHSVAVSHEDFAPSDEQPREALGELVHELEPGVEVAGHAVTEDGSPVQGATVFLEGWPVASSNRRGFFRIRHCRSTHNRIWASTGPLAGWAEPSVPKKLITLRPARCVEGSVREVGSGKPVAGAGIVVRPTPFLWWLPDARTERTGAFHLTLAESQHVRVYANHADHASSGGHDLDPRSTSRLLVDLERLHPTPWRAVDSLGRPVSGAYVEVGQTVTYGRRWRFGWRGDTSFADGSFWLPADVPNAAQVASVVACGYQAGEATEERGSGADEEQRRVMLGTGYEVQGRAVDESGRPIEGAEVAAVVEHQGPAFGSSLGQDLEKGEIEGLCRAGSDGSFVLHLGMGPHRVAAWAEGYLPAEATVWPGLAGRPPLELVMRVAATVTGRVRTSRGRWVGGIPVSGSQKGRTVGSSTGVDGRFVFRGLQPGRVELWPDLRCLDVRRVEVTAPTTGAVITLPPAGGLSLEVQDLSAGGPLEVFEVRLEDVVSNGQGDPRTEIEEYSTEHGGLLLLPYLPAGRYRLTVEAEDGRFQVVPEVVVEPDRLTRLKVPFAAKLGVRGRVLDAAGRPLEGVQVEAPSNGQSRWPTRVETDALGAFSVGGLAGGPANLTFYKPGTRRVAKTVVVGRDTEIEVTLPPACGLQGEVVSADGRPIGSVRLSACCPECHTACESAFTDEQGRFCFGELGPHKYRVTATAAGYSNLQRDDVDPARAGPLHLTLSTQEKGTISVLVRDLPEWTKDASALAWFKVEGLGVFRVPLGADGRAELREVPVGEATVHITLMSPSTVVGSPWEKVLVPRDGVVSLELKVPDGQVCGRVTQDETPLPWADVELRALARGAGWLVRVPTDRNGEFHASNLVGGPTEIAFVRGSSGDSCRSRHDIGPASYPEIEVGANFVRGLVLDAATGRPISCASVRLQETRGSSFVRPVLAEAATTAEGRFAVAAPSPGSYFVQVQALGYISQIRNALAGDGCGTDVVLELVRGPGISVALVDGKDQHPLRGTVLVRELSRTQEPYAPAIPNPDREGELILPIVPGAHAIAALVPGYQPTTTMVPRFSAMFSVAMNLGGSVRLVAPSTLRAGVSVRTPGGAARMLDWEKGLTTVELVDGQADLDGLPPGPVEVVVTPRDGKPSRCLEVTVVAGQTTWATIE